MRVVHPRTGKQINLAEVIGGRVPHPTGDDAVRAEREADVLLRMSVRAGVTVAGWWADWTTDPLWLRPSESTNIHNRERTAKFAAAHGDKPIRAIDDDLVAAGCAAATTAPPSRSAPCSTTPPAPPPEGS